MPRPLSAKTVRNTAGALWSFFARAIKWGLIATSPVSRSEPPVPKKHEGMAPIPAEQMLLIKSAAGPWRLRMILEMSTVTGARRGEVLALRWSDITAKELTITRPLTQTKHALQFKGTKSEKPRRGRNCQDEFRHKTAAEMESGFSGVPSGFAKVRSRRYGSGDRI